MNKEDVKSKPGAQFLAEPRMIQSHLVLDKLKAPKVFVNGALKVQPGWLF